MVKVTAAFNGVTTTYNAGALLLGPLGQGHGPVLLRRCLLPRPPGSALHRIRPSDAHVPAHRLPPISTVSMMRCTAAIVIRWSRWRSPLSANGFPPRGRKPADWIRASPRISVARWNRGNRCSRFAFMRPRGIVHTPSVRSISFHAAHRTSLHLAISPGPHVSNHGVLRSEDRSDLLLPRVVFISVKTKQKPCSVNPCGVHLIHSSQLT